MSLRTPALIASVALALFPAFGHAADYRTEYDKKIKAAQNVGALGNDLAGDSVNFYTGAVSFSATDISIPGNSGLSVALGRSYGVEPNRQRAVTGANGSETIGTVQRLFGDWDLDIPYLSTTMTQGGGWIVDTTTPTARCSVIGQSKPGGVSGQPNGAPPVDSSLGAGSMGPHKYWHGYSLHLPGGDQTMLLASLTNNERPATGTYHWTTNRDWWFSCLSSTANGVSGEAFKAHAPDGSVYTFDWMSKRNVDDVLRDVELQGQQHNLYITYRAEYMLLPTRIEDRFGNWVKYTWSSDTFARLQTITSGPVGTTTPDRTLTLSYNGSGFVSSATDGTRTWTYTYTSGSLTQVTLPDNSAWQYGFAGLNMLEPQPPEFCEFNREQDPWGCFGIPSGVPGTPTGYVVHPSGARVDFTFAAHFQLGGQDGWFYPLGLKEKKISGPGMTDAIWKYAFSPSVSEALNACQTTACPGRIATDELAPDGSVTRRVFGIVAEVDESLLQAQFDGVMTATGTSGGGTAAITCTTAYCSDAAAISQIDGSTVPVFYRETINTYVPSSPTPSYVVRVGVNPLTGPVTQGSTYPSERRLPMQQRVLTTQGVAFTHTTNSFNAYAQPTSVTSASTGSAGGNNSRTDTMTYTHDTTKWVIGQLATTTDAATSTVTSQTDYDSTTRLPWKTYKFGLLQNTMTYNANGTLATVKDGLNNTITLSNWYRGIPQGIAYPTSVSESATVNGLGQITGTTDELGYSHSYGYDSLGRLSSITYPTGDTNAWAGLSRTFVPVAGTEYGLGAGHWKQTVQTGNGKATTYYDAMWRPVLVLTEDTGNASSKSFVVTRYDSSGRPVFQSYPVGSLTTVNDSLTGVSTVYDGLGRVYQVKQDSELGVLETKTEYLTGFITRVTNPRGFVSETKYQVFDSPGTDAPVEIITAKGQPEQQTTTIVRDGFGLPLSVTRSGAAP